MQAKTIGCLVVSVALFGCGEPEANNGANNGGSNNGGANNGGSNNGGSNNGGSNNGGSNNGGTNNGGGGTFADGRNDFSNITVVSEGTTYADFDCTVGGAEEGLTYTNVINGDPVLIESQCGHGGGYNPALRINLGEFTEGTWTGPAEIDPEFSIVFYADGGSQELATAVANSLSDDSTFTLDMVDLENRVIQGTLDLTVVPGMTLNGMPIDTSGSVKGTFQVKYEAL